MRASKRQVADVRFAASNTHATRNKRMIVLWKPRDPIVVCRERSRIRDLAPTASQIDLKLFTCSRVEMTLSVKTRKKERKREGNRQEASVSHRTEKDKNS